MPRRRELATQRVEVKGHRKGMLPLPNSSMELPERNAAPCRTLKDLALLPVFRIIAALLLESTGDDGRDLSPQPVAHPSAAPWPRTGRRVLGPEVARHD